MIFLVEAKPLAQSADPAGRKSTREGTAESGTP
jgi:hypothetical protein